MYIYIYAADMIAYYELYIILVVSGTEYTCTYMCIYTYIYIYIYEITMHQIYDTRLPFLHVFFGGSPF